jgi:hypothetical protein
MTQYPSLARLLRPGLLPAYEVCAWLVSSDERARGLGRSTALAAAFLREGILGRSSRVWDHAAMQGKASFLVDKIRGMADELGLHATFDSQQNILRKVESKDPSVHPTSVIAADDVVVLLETLRRSVQNMLSVGIPPEDVAAAAKRMAYETVVDEVHDL